VDAAQVDFSFAFNDTPKNLEPPIMVEKNLIGVM